MARTKTSFKHGQSGNPKGRPPGISAEKAWFDEFFTGDQSLAKKDWQKLSPNQRWTIRAKSWDFRFPKLRSEYLDINLDSMSDELAGKIIAEVLTQTIKNEVKYKGSDGGENDPAGNN